MFKQKFGNTERNYGYGHDPHEDARDHTLDVQTEELEGSPYGRRKQQFQNQPRTEEAIPLQQASKQIRPPSPPVPPPHDLDDTFDLKPIPVSRTSSGPSAAPGTRAETYKQALSSILSNVAAKNGHHDAHPQRDYGAEKGEPRYSFSSEGSSDEMLPPPPLAISSPSPQTPEKQLMTSTLFDRFSAKLGSSFSGKGKQPEKEKLTKAPPSKVASSRSAPSPLNPTPPPISPAVPTTDPSVYTYGLPPVPASYGYYHQPVQQKKSFPEIPSHPFSPAETPTPTKPTLSTIFQEGMTPSTASSASDHERGDSPPTFKAKSKGELRSIEISSPVLISSSNKHVSQQLRHTEATQPPVSPAPGGAGPYGAPYGVEQPLSAARLQKVVYEYAIPSAPLETLPRPPSSSPPHSPVGQEVPYATSAKQSHSLALEQRESMSEIGRRAVEQILTQELEEDIPSGRRTHYASEGPRPSQQTSDTSTERKPFSAGETVAEILANRQPVSVRISIQKHKTETSYKKSQSFGRDGQGHDKEKSGGGGGSKHREAPFSESSL